MELKIIEDKDIIKKEYEESYFHSKIYNYIYNKLKDYNLESLDKLVTQITESLVEYKNENIHIIVTNEKYNESRTVVVIKDGDKLIIENIKDIIGGETQTYYYVKDNDSLFFNSTNKCNKAPTISAYLKEKNIYIPDSHIKVFKLYININK